MTMQIYQKKDIEQEGGFLMLVDKCARYYGHDVVAKFCVRCALETRSMNDEMIIRLCTGGTIDNDELRHTFASQLREELIHGMLFHSADGVVEDEEVIMELFDETYQKLSETT